MELTLQLPETIVSVMYTTVLCTLCSLIDIINGTGLETCTHDITSQCIINCAVGMLGTTDRAAVDVTETSRIYVFL